MRRIHTLLQGGILSAALMCGHATLHAEEGTGSQPTWWFGAAGASNINFYHGTMQQLTPTLTTPNPFHKGSGRGFFAGVLAEYRPDPVWGGMLHVGIDDRRGSFDDIVTPCNCPATLSTKLSYLSIEPSLRIAPFSPRLYFFVGPRIGVNLSKKFTYREAGNPSVTTTGDLSNMHSTVISGQIGAGYDIPLTSPEAYNQIELSPFISFHPYFGQRPRTIENWTVTTLRAGAALKFGSGAEHEQEALVPASEGDVAFSVRAPKVVPVQRRVRETFPLRNYVFFDEGSSGIPARYVMLTKAQATGFKEEQLQEVQPADTTGRSRRQMSVYYNILNILGDRMRRNPGTELSLGGATGKGAEDGRALAESIKQYLVDVFGIDAGSITTEGLAQPRIPSEEPGGTRELALLRAEDRRVEIASKSPALLMQVGGPSVMLKPVQIYAWQDNPLDSHVVFTVERATELLSSWSLEVSDDHGFVQRFGPYSRDQESVPGKSILGSRPEGDFKVVMLGNRKSGKMVRKEGSVHLARVNEAAPEGLRFSILFEFDRSTTIASYERFLTEMVAPLIPDGGNVIIHGHTDVIGTESYNHTLSHERAQEAQRILERALSGVGKHAVTFDSYGFGEDLSYAPFDNGLPEERFYNRTVIIDIVPAK